MKPPERTFVDKPAQREQVPLLVGLYGPSGCGKTYSALRLATGIQRVTGGDIIGIDTESKRMLHYADRFTFRHLEFGAPFSPLDYLDAIRHCVKQGAKTIIIDSMSHEHEGPGGVLEMHETELDRLAGNDERKRYAMNLLGWARPKAERRRLLNEILQFQCNFVFCFRAKEKVKPKKKGDSGEAIVQLGWMPISGDEFVYEMTVNALLLPGSGGVPSWRSDEVGSASVIKRPEQFRDLFAKSVPFDESIGEVLAKWAKGGVPSKAPDTTPSLAQRLDKAVAFFVGREVPLSAILATLGVGSQSALNESHLAQLDAFRKALASKSKTLDDIFAAPAEVQGEVPEFLPHELAEAREPGSDG